MEPMEIEPMGSTEATGSMEMEATESMEIDDPLYNLQGVSIERDTLDDQGHQKLDKICNEILAVHRDIPSHPTWAVLLLQIVESDRRLTRFASSEDAAALLREEPAIEFVLRDAWNSGKYDQVRRLDCLWPPLASGQGDAYMSSLSIGGEATELSWKEEYKGDGWRVISEKVDSISGDVQKYYARYFAIVQSSGTGKSRMVDEYSKHNVVISLCLREGETGYPPPDTQVRDFLLNHKSNKSTSLKITYAFLYCLFDETKKRLLDIRRSATTNVDVAQKFRLLMVERLKRADFYDNVVREAKLMCLPHPQRPIQKTIGATEQHTARSPASPHLQQSVSGSKEPIQLALPSGSSAASPSMSRSSSGHIDPQALADMAKEMVDALSSPHSGTLERQHTILLSFDESHTLTDEFATSQNAPDWSAHFSLRHALRSIISVNVISVFLSTSGKLSQFIPTIHDDPSRRIQTFELKQHQPICGLEYDLMARGFVKDNAHSLEAYSSLKGMSRFGRPMFYLRYKHGTEEVRNMLLEFACEKILGGRGVPKKLELEEGHKLAILSIRLPLDFTMMTLKGRRAGFEQVHKHMRLCINVRDSFDACDSVQPAEPLLAEAAFHLSKRAKLDHAEALRELLEGPSLDKGDRGEVTTMLLWLLARDEAVTAMPGRPSLVKLIDLMKALFGEEWFSMIRDAKPSRLASSNDDRTFHETFEDATVYLTQFLKVNSDDVIKRHFLWFSLARGAGIMCKDCQPGIDLLIPFHMGKGNVGANATSAIFVQVKNNASYGAIPSKSLFLDMNPYKMGFVSPSENTIKPIIRMVFALAAKTPNVVVIGRPSPRRVQPMSKTSRVKLPPTFTSYDIWCAKASNATFSVIKDDSTFEALLKIGNVFPAAYQNGLKEEEKRRRTLHPMAFGDCSHWVGTVEEPSMAYGNTEMSYDEGWFDSESDSN